MRCPHCLSCFFDELREELGSVETPAAGFTGFVPAQSLAAVGGQKFRGPVRFEVTTPYLVFCSTLASSEILTSQGQNALSGFWSFG
jgi:hypothetical protein